MKTIDAISIAMAAIEVGTARMPDGDAKTALRVLRITRRGELDKQDADALASLSRKEPTT